MEIEISLCLIKVYINIRMQIECSNNLWQVICYSEYNGGNDSC